jgi:DNA repair protein RadC
MTSTSLIRVSVKGPHCIVERFRERLRHLTTEQLWVVTMRTDHSVIREHMIREGESRTVRFKPRELLRPAVIDEADVIVFLHNHPSGNVRPSKIDRDSTEQLEAACQILGIRLLDSLIIAGDESYSFADDGQLKGST